MLEMIEESDVYKVRGRINFSDTICCNCRNNETYIQSNGRPLWFCCKCNRENCTGYLCNKCYNIQRYNIRKLDTQCRRGEFDIKKKMCRGCIGVQIIGNTLLLKNLNIEMDDFNFYIDLSEHSIYGYIEVKIATLNKKNGKWEFNTKKRQIYDNIFLICMDNNEIWKNIQKLYIVPWNDAVGRTHITIYENSSRGWYQKFEADIRPFNDTYHDMSIGCPINLK